MYRALTVAREYGSGGARIAAIAAERLGWKLLDRALVDEIANLASVDVQLARRYDERLDSWAHRLSRRALWHGAFDAVAVLPETGVFDAETMAHLTRAVIEHAYEVGNCVIVGRAGQCILQQHEDVFHVLVYAPWADRLARIRARHGAAEDAAESIRKIDAERTRYVRINFGLDRHDPHLYDLMISSKPGEDAAASTILAAMGKE
ncbi:MAG TPA: cytidylate kinase-like family protein [Bryobacteraceae bacterium]|nr:cytidylate kinase-like family protein [Bryobacteraceae bacterium]